MQTCFVVPGFCASELRIGSSAGPTLWVSYTRLALGEVGKARLAPDGISPGPPDGVALFPGPPLYEYYAALTEQLGRDLRPAGYQVTWWGYDWRKTIATNGALLAQLVRDNATPARPAAIVGHSLGGLIARSAWTILSASGESNLLRRIVTLGAPHGGSYSTIALLSGQEEILSQILFLSLLVRIAVNPAGLIIPLPAWNIQKLVQLCASWPCLYELFPLLDGQTADEDPFRQELYDIANWPAGRGVQQRWLEYSRDVTGPWLRSPASLPPSNVLTTVAGNFSPTPHRLLVSGHVGDASAIGSTTAGDERVALDDALLPTSARYVAPIRHVDFSVSSQILALLPGWILDERPPPPPDPGVKILQGPMIPILSGPPLAQTAKLDPDC